MEIIVRIIKVNPWSGITKWANCFDYIGSYITRSGNLYTGLTREKAEEFENKLGYPAGHLSPTSTFWDTFAVKVGKDDVILNTDRPEDELKYWFLKSHKRVANGVSNITPSTDYLLINQDAEAEMMNKRSRIKKEAIVASTKMSIEEMRKCLRLFGIKSDTISNELVEAKLNEIIEKDPDSFMTRWVNNPNRDMAFIIETAISKNIIRRNKSQYYFGTDNIGNGLEDVINYLNNKKNQDIKLAILSEIEAKK